ncbi:MAG: aspartate/glutamate racemase family protein [Pseudomonadota bacterium]
MKTIGILGGMSWESSAQYYALINEGVRDRVGGIASAKILMHSFDFAQIAQWQAEDAWDALGALLSEAAAGLERAGADGLVIATNTMHLVAPQVEKAVSIPLVHIADPLGRALSRAGHRKVGLLATRFTMEKQFYAERLATQGIDVAIPQTEDRKELHRIIFDELCAGEVRESSRDFAHGVIADLKAQGVTAITLACTELMLLIKPQHSALPLFDTTALHCAAAVDFALSD